MQLSVSQLIYLLLKIDCMMASIYELLAIKLGPELADKYVETIYRLGAKRRVLNNKIWKNLYDFKKIFEEVTGFTLYVWIIDRNSTIDVVNNYGGIVGFIADSNGIKYAFNVYGIDEEGFISVRQVNNPFA